MRFLEARFSVPRAIPASRAALGLVAVLKCWRRRRGTCRVALPGAICHEVVLAVLAAGCEPVFCDVDVADGLVKETEWVKARSLGADVAIVVHLYGNPGRINHVRSIFPAPDCLVVDDAAQALGSFSQDGDAGGMGDIGLLSFGLTKQIPLGNAAILFHNPEFAEELDSILASLLPADEALRAALATNFRLRLDLVRARLRVEGEKAANGFAGLLDGMEAVLFAPLSIGVEDSILRVLGDYSEASKARIVKARLWASCLTGTGFEPVGMGAGCVPWRYACRLPGIDWSTQHHLAEVMRATGMHVSNWYLPAHWFLGCGAGTLSGVEELSREVFQFWVDDSVTHESIVRDATVIRRIISNLRDYQNRANE
jgi:hypothetical protein